MEEANKEQVSFELGLGGRQGSYGSCGTAFQRGQELRGGQGYREGGHSGQVEERRGGTRGGRGCVER